MNLITADFNWISLIVIVVAGIIGIRRSRSGKPGNPSDTHFPEFEPWMEESKEEQEEEETWERIEETPVSSLFPEGSDRLRQTCSEKESPAATASEEEKEEHPSFDIRQAIIGSEILKRPEF